MSKISIYVYKPSGKYYTDGSVDIPEGLYTWMDDFTLFIYENLPAKYEGGYVVVHDLDDECGEFHDCLIPFDRLRGDAECLKRLRGL